MATRAQIIFPSQAEIRPSMASALRIGIVAGEASGDELGAGLMHAIQQIHPQASFQGIGGPKMQALGCRSSVPMERLSVMGLVEVLGRIGELLRIRRNLVRDFITNPPDIFIGIDAPDFNLGLEKKLKKAGIKTAHYVSPQVWAWRQGRVKSIGRSVDLILALFPFEKDFYQKHHVPVEFIGHPLADSIELNTPAEPARRALGLGQEDPVIALLPGSRMGEASRLTDTFLQAAKICKEQTGCQVLIAAANEPVAELVRGKLANYPALAQAQLVTGQAQQAMAAADALLLASGTVTLEAALIKRPMVVAYKLAPTTYRIASRLVKIPFISLPNLLAQRQLVPEFIQDEANPENLGRALVDCITQREARAEQNRAFEDIHRQLRCGASEQAARAVLGLLRA